MVISWLGLSIQLGLGLGLGTGNGFYSFLKNDEHLMQWCHLWQCGV